MPFQRPVLGQQDGKGPATFDFLGFTLHGRRTRGGRWRLACKTRRARLGRAIQAVYAWCRGQRHEEVAVQHAGLRSRWQGHSNYFGVNGNQRSLACLGWHARRAWYKWLNRRSQRTRWTWERFQDLLRDFPLPNPRVMVRIWGGGTARRDHGGAGWWKSPCPDLRGPRLGNWPGLLDLA